jgi:hypothetical protein
MSIKAKLEELVQEVEAHDGPRDLANRVVGALKHAVACAHELEAYVAPEEAAVQEEEPEAEPESDVVADAPQPAEAEAPAVDEPAAESEPTAADPAAPVDAADDKE